ncbi:dicer-like protein 2 [Lasallia pustulata]|uniref:Dicer-like protein 2 n=1 Tax=Lasallia pustulata TaxID=136370 RepID=A0A1W5CYD5_9LECA|nr:dicer-like protein 2 [Lasallia pustulata]
MKPRSYQLEMLEESLRRNIIVACISLKQYRAVLRIAAELERSPADKLVWFLAPTVALAEQQFNVISSQIPAFQTRFLSGADNVDHWSDQWMWDEVLHNVRIVVSTHQILLDALTHGFLGLARISLLVFDEAHHCARSHPYNRIMKEFYKPHISAASEGGPHILGLSASPTTKTGGLQTLEQNMNSISRTPKFHREEMLQYVYLPSLVRLDYTASVLATSSAPVLRSLGEVFAALDIKKDPYVLKLEADGSANAQRQLKKALLSDKTHSRDEIRNLYNKAVDIYHELGPWAAEFYIVSCIAKLQKRDQGSFCDFAARDHEEDTYVRAALSSIRIPPDTCSFQGNDKQISPKMQRLVNFLIEETGPDFIGLMFVKTRAAVAVLAHLLSIHPVLQNRVKVSTFVGQSTSTKRKASIGELLDVKLQRETLDDLRYGRRNLVIATTVLEEGIDVSACNIVICFERPANLRSFIQRRGRARKSGSKFVIMQEAQKDNVPVSGWQELEEEMKRLYMDHTRSLQEIHDLEAVEEDNRCFQVETTGAKITLENAVPHLYHFCATLPKSQYVDFRPEFSIADYDDDSFTAKVFLPNAVDASVREACSSARWATERFAKRDAAFEAYVALYHAGLVNDHLLPLPSYDRLAAEMYAAVEQRVALVDVSEQHNPWVEIAQAWEAEPFLHQMNVTVQRESQKPIEMVMFCPRQVPQMGSFDLYWDANRIFQVVVTRGSPAPYAHGHLALARQITASLLSSVFPSRMSPGRDDFPILFEPSLERAERQSWIQSVEGHRPAKEVFEGQPTRQEFGLIRDLSQNGVPHVYHEVLYGRPEPLANNDINGEDTVFLKVTRLPKRADFLHPIPAQNAGLTGSGYKYLPASACEMDQLPFSYSQFALFIPSIMHVLEIHMVAQHLCTNLLLSILFKDLASVVTAISASKARERTNYQRLEFIGDSVLKLFTSITLMAEHGNWHEGFLSHKKDHIVSNTRLAAAAQETGLGKYILTRPFTGNKWRPLYNSDLVKNQAKGTREMSTKTLADVVEALIGAAYLDGGVEKALACIKVFLPEVSWLPLSAQHQSLYNAVPHDVKPPPRFIQLEELIGYTFTQKAPLIDAMTHPSYSGPNAGMSYQRLEFLGDAILDNIVVNTVFSRAAHLPHHSMHTIRTALVNANFLAFLCLQFHISESRSELVEDATTGTFHPVETRIPLYLWHFMRTSSADVRRAQHACAARFDALREQIRNALEHGDAYPWALLSRLEAEKFFSDIVEAVLGAVYIDSLGSIPACEAVLERFGLLAYLRRALDEKVRLLHPKEEVGVLAGNEKVKPFKLSTEAED